MRGLGSERHTLAEFWVAPAARRTGIGRALALDVLGRHPGAWEVAFQHGNASAVRFWRAVAQSAWGEAWTETEEPVPGRLDVPPDHWIRTVP